MDASRSDVRVADLAEVHSAMVCKGSAVEVAVRDSEPRAGMACAANVQTTDMTAAEMTTAKVGNAATTAEVTTAEMAAAKVSTSEMAATEMTATPTKVAAASATAAATAGPPGKRRSGERGRENEERNCNAGFRHGFLPPIRSCHSIDAAGSRKFPVGTRRRDGAKPNL